MSNALLEECPSPEVETELSATNGEKHVNGDNDNGHWSVTQYAEERLREKIVSSYEKKTGEKLPEGLVGEKLRERFGKTYHRLFANPERDNANHT